MLKSIFTPLKTKFDQSVSLFSPATAPPLPDTFQENIAVDDGRDSEAVMILKVCIEEVKMTDDAMERIKACFCFASVVVIYSADFAQLLLEIERVFQADAAVKDAFRELDGFLVIMSLLSTLQDVENISTRLDLVSHALFILSDAMLCSPRNKAYFNVSHIVYHINHDSFVT